ncbi:DUF5329 domain-containing protein [Vogesella indigofera]|uniref:DUF5329 domain-containing protein n=1 Tax=Vogesella indigofera TaxID=45465 RepID=UPI00234F8AA6|nr:DUF5329 domain-containing protein [Vogesella indigofera]MDC7709836.1 DUF5329 domain-containing protein [Vogesella indigofera]
MTRRRWWLLLPWLAAMSQAQPLPPVQQEVGRLLAEVAASGCEFYRNGGWYDAAAAARHLRDKYQYLQARRPLARTEDFIEQAASRSSFSGTAYRVRCPGQATVSSRQWLLARLARLRGG